MTITLTEAQTRLRKLAADRPDYVYERPNAGDGPCVYFAEGDTPSCIVGHAFADELRARGINHYHPGNTLAVRFLSALRLEGVARDYVAEVQGAQDSGVPWGRAVAEADRRLAEGTL